VPRGPRDGRADGKGACLKREVWRMLWWAHVNETPNRDMSKTSWSSRHGTFLPLFIVILPIMS
jgi:hypothetical protein